MKEFLNKIHQILVEEIDEFPVPTDDLEVLDSDEEVEFDEYYTDHYVLVRNLDAFYGPDKSVKAAMLLESFLLESMIHLKKNPENIVVESGEFYVKATAFTPDGDVLLSVFEDAVVVNTMAEYYNQALVENGYPRMDIGIGFATFVKQELDEHDHDHDHEEGHVCDDETCSCHHDHEDNELEYGIDFANTASQLASIAGQDGLEPIMLNELAYEMLLEVEHDFFEAHLEGITLEDDTVVYHGNIVSED